MWRAPKYRSAICQALCGTRVWRKTRRPENLIEQRQGDLRGDAARLKPLCEELLRDRLACRLVKRREMERLHQQQMPALFDVERADDLTRLCAEDGGLNGRLQFLPTH